MKPFLVVGGLAACLAVAVCLPFYFVLPDAS
jgi:hypothetical protein